MTKESARPSGSRVLAALRRLFSFPVAIACMLGALAVLTARGRFDDPDMWWHLKMGQVIWTAHAIPTHDLFSYTASHQAIVPQEWLSEVTIYLAYFLGGFRGMMLWFCAFASVLLVSGYILCWLYSKNAKTSFAGALTIWYFATAGFSIRPQMVSDLLLVAELFLIYAGRKYRPGWFLGLPVVFALWVNCHASFPLGILLACIYLGCSFVEFEIGSLDVRRWDAQRQRMLALSIGLSIAALLINPIGIRQILYPFDTLFNMPSLLTSIEEWAPLRMTEERGIGLMVILFCCALLVIIRKSQIFLDELILLSLGTWLAISHVRMLFVFGVLAGPVVSRQFADCCDGYEPNRDRVLPNLLVIGLALLTVILAFPSQRNLEDQVAAKSPVKAVEFIKNNHLSGPMLNHYIYGGFLIWAAPDYPVMIDGRTDVYEWAGIFDEYQQWATLQSDPNLLLKKYKISFCLVPADSPAARILSLLGGWHSIYSDDQSTVFVREALSQTPENSVETGQAGTAPGHVNSRDLHP